MISEKEAFNIIDEFIKEVLNTTNKVIGVYAIGSLGGNYYRPGKSDIDTLLIVRNDFDKHDEVEEIANKYFNKYNVPKGFGAIIIKENQLYPPYNYADELILEIVRLKVQSKQVYGEYNIKDIPMPNTIDLIKDAIAFEKWCNSEFGEDMFKGLSEVGVINTILIHLKRYLMINNNTIELNKLKVIEKVKEAKVDLDYEMLDKINEYLNGNETKIDLENLKKFAFNLRLNFNKMLLSIN